MKRANPMWMAILLCLSVSQALAQDAGEAKGRHLSDAEGHHRQALRHYDEGQYEKALESFQQALALKPDDPVAYNNLGMAYTSMGRHKEAAEFFREAIRVKPDWERASL